jgi:hypothetical protein
MMYVSFNSNTTGDTSGAETGNPFGFLIPYCTVYFIGIIVIPFVLFLLTIFCLFCDLRLLFIPLIKNEPNIILVGSALLLVISSLCCGFCVVFFLHCLFVLVMCLAYPMLPVSLGCPFLIAPSEFSNVYVLAMMHEIVNEV